ncbi:hypothetical protein HDV00_002998 [Rhizophlyctis rosea]|nr:hypothetical protein HDV00_002998 [Rhizophlyctis rosea]
MPPSLDYDHFPTPAQNVKVIEVKQVVNDAGKKIVRRGLVVEEDFEEGEDIYMEEAVVAIADKNVEDQTCAHCLSALSSAETTHTCPTCTNQFCSSICLATAQKQYHTLLCSGRAEDGTGDNVKKLEALCEERGSRYPLLAARFLAVMVWREMGGEEEGEGKGEGEYSTWDHFERLHDLKQPATEQDTEEAELIKSILAPQVPGFDEFLTTPRYTLIKNKLLYNSYGIALPFPPSTSTTRRTSHPSSHATALTLLTSYISHSCDPNVSVEYEAKEGKGVVMRVVARKEVKKGEEILVSYVGVGSGDGERGVKERRKEIKAKVR